jgi:hypothetical protein
MENVMRCRCSGGWYWAMPLVLFAAPTPAAYKCVEDNGRIFYQAAPCPANTRGGDMSLNVNRPFAGQARRPPAPEATPIPAEPTDLPIDGEPNQNAPPPDGESR